jgi:hypothetical protein
MLSSRDECGETLPGFGLQTSLAKADCVKAKRKRAVSDQAMG